MEADISEETLHRRAANTLDELETAYIGTIHAYCSDLLRRYPTQADLPPEFNIDEGFGQDFLFEEVWSDFLTEELGTNPARPDLWQRILSRFLEREIEEVAASLIRDPVACDHLAENGYLGLDVQSTYGDEVRGLIVALRACQDDLQPVKRKTPGYPEMVETALLLLELFLEGGTDALRGVDTESLPDKKIFGRKESLKPKPKPGSEDRIDDGLVRHVAQANPEGLVGAEDIGGCSGGVEHGHLGASQHTNCHFLRAIVDYPAWSRDFASAFGQRSPDVPACLGTSNSYRSRRANFFGEFE